MERSYLNIELFSCAGGMAEGFRRAGVEFDIAIDMDPNHCESYEMNLGHRPWQMDARSFYEMLLSGWRPPKPIALLVADPPCTPWSRAGKRMGTDDPRDMLEGTCRIIAELQPSVYLIGNVPGLDDGPNLHIVQHHIGSLSKHGYCTADFARLDAANYGVPQHRVRPFWFGHRIDTPCIVWPVPTHGDPDHIGDQLTIPGVTPLIPWVTCRQALGHLSLEQLGRPIKLRKREQHSLQSGSVPERPARVVGTSNLSDGNVLLFPEQPRAGKRGRKRDRDRTSQGNRVGSLEKPSATVTAKPARKGAGAHSVFTIQPDRSGHGEGVDYLNHFDKPANTILRNTHGNGCILINDKHPPAELDEPAHAVGAKSRGSCSTLSLGVHTVTERSRLSTLDAPARTATAAARGTQVLSMEKHHPPSQYDEPAMCVRAGSGGGANRALVVPTEKHRMTRDDEPAHTVRGGGDGHSAPAIVITSSNHPASSEHEPSNTIRATTGAGSNRALEWPWDRPATTVQGDPRVAPPGHHDADYAIRSLPGGVVISELAATILQGFPETWKFHGKTKKIRWSQLGQAMPPPLAYAVATSVVTQIQRTLQDLRRLEPMALPLVRF